VSERFSKVPDALLFDPEVDDYTLIRVAVALGFPGRDPSSRQIKQVAPIKDERLAHAAREIARLRIASVLRPRRGARDRAKLQKLRLVGFPPHLDPDAGAPWVGLPHALSAPLKGRKGGAFAFRVLALYLREQRRRGAVQIGDEEAAWLLGRTVKQIRAASRMLERTGALVTFAPACDGYPPVYIIPGAPEHNPPRPDELIPARTRTLLALPVGEHTITIYASEGEHALLRPTVHESLADVSADRLLALWGTRPGATIHGKGLPTLARRALQSLRIDPARTLREAVSESGEVRSEKLSTRFREAVSAIEGRQLDLDLNPLYERSERINETRHC
jgi:hypothetical protein